MPSGGLSEIFFGKGLVPRDVREVGAVLQELLSPLVLKLGLVLVLGEGKRQRLQPPPHTRHLPKASYPGLYAPPRNREPGKKGRGTCLGAGAVPSPVMGQHLPRCPSAQADAMNQVLICRPLSATHSHFTGDEAEAQRSPLPQVAQLWRSGVGRMPVLEPAGCL